jgi:hypothetical protein
MIRSPRVTAAGAARTLVVGALTVVLAAAGAAAQGPSPAGSGPVPVASAVPFPATIAAPGSDPLGVSYEEWTNRYWNWLFSFPAASSDDVFDADVCPPSPGKDITFLPTAFFGTVQQMTCEVPAGTPILVFAGGSFCDTSGGTTVAELPGCLADSDATISSPSIAVDGRLVPDIDSYHVGDGKPFKLTLVKDNLFELPEGTEDAAGTGWLTILSDLAPGTHTIVARDETTDPGLGPQAAEVVATITVTE